MRVRLVLAPMVALTAVAPPALHAAVYLSVSQAQALMFPGQQLTADFVTLDDAQVKAIERDAHAPVLTREVRAWRASGGGWFLADQVYGKHELIAYAVALDGTGSVQRVEILSYQEAYGGEVRLPAWRAQFVGKHHGDAVRLDDDIRNVSGATISCGHVTDGVRRLLSTWALVLAPQAHG